MTHKFTHGWNRQAPDPRDRFFFARPVTSVPAFAAVDFSRVPLLNQGQEGSCGPNAMEELIYCDQVQQGLPLVGASRLFGYWWTRFLMGDTAHDTGVDNRTLCKAYATYGFLPEASDPYDDSPASMVRKPTDAMCAAAMPNRITDYAAVVQGLGQMKGTLAAGKPFLFGFEVFPQIDSDQAAANGILTMPKGTSIGGHDVSLTAYSDVDRPGELPGSHWPAGHFKGRNHWVRSDGKPWGDNGNIYVPYSYAASAKYAGDFWVVNTVPGGITPPPQPPPPGGTAYFFLRYSTGRNAGDPIAFNTPVAFPPGTYGWVQTAGEVHVVEMP